MRTRLSLCVALLAGALLSGCGGADSGDSYSPSPSSSAPSDMGASVDPGTGSPGAVTITGTPTEGVEDGCLVMQSGNTLYLLLGGDRMALLSGQRVAVEGTPAPGLMTTCQQGTPFRVSSVRPA